MFNKVYILRKRLKIITIVLLGILIVLIIRLFYVQNKYNPVVSGSEVNNSIEKEEIGDYNYLLLDRNGKDLNEYRKKYKVAIDSRTFMLNSMNQNLENFISFNYIMSEEVEDFNVEEIINLYGKYSYDVSEESYNKIKSLEGLKGIYIYEYDEKEDQDIWSIENMLMKEKGFNGYKNIDNYDKNENSLEGQIVKYTKDNKSTQIVFEKDIDGIYEEGQYEIDKNNKNIRLTLDSDYQDIIRKVLSKDEYKDYENIGVTLVKGNTGEVLALAQKDEKQANIVTGAGSISGFEPGSTFKIITLEAAMKYNNVTPLDEYVCEGTLCKESNRHGKISVKRAMEVSCNNIFAKLGGDVGYDKLLKFAETQGYYNSVLNLDRETGMESIGVPASAGAKGITAIGQGSLATPLQVVGMMSTIVNDGKYIKPYILSGVESQDGKNIKSFSSKSVDTISKHQADSIKYTLRESVLDGTGRRAGVEGVEIGGKTGTTESNNDSSHGWFVGYFNLNGEYYNMVVFVPNIKGKNEEGQEMGGGNTAAPIFGDIVSELIKK